MVETSTSIYGPKRPLSQSNSSPSELASGFVRWTHTVSPSTYYNLAANTTHLNRDTYYGTNFDPNAYGKTRNPLLNADASFGHQAGEHLLSAGFQYQRESVEDRIPSYNRDFDETFTNAGVYTQDQFRVTNRVTVVGGVRVDKANTLDEVVASPRANVKIGLNDSLNARFGLSTGMISFITKPQITSGYLSHLGRRS